MSSFNIEENELSFIELFTEKVLVSKYVTIYYNCNLDDEFFNRIMVKDANALEDIGEALSILEGKGITPYIYSMSSIEGYSLYDSIVTLVHDGTDMGEKDYIVCKDVDDADTWLDVFFDSFNITNKNYRDEFRCKIKDNLHLSNLILNLAYIKDEPVGCSILFSSDNVMGIYCLGVLKEHRRQGVAGMLLRDAIIRSKGNNRMLIVQTFARDTLLLFYRKHGFRYAYSKFIYTTY